MGGGQGNTASSLRATVAGGGFNTASGRYSFAGGNEGQATNDGAFVWADSQGGFRFRTNFDGYLYVTNQSTSGKYEQLFPREETGQNNRIVAGKDYQVPATSVAFRIAGPPGHEIVYWLVSPVRLNDVPPRPTLPPAGNTTPITLLPRCDESIMKARGDCVDSSAGLKLIPRDVDLSKDLSAANAASRDLVFMRQQNTAVISSPEPLTGPVIYEFQLAHR